jgi:hypothetical protein
MVYSFCGVWVGESLITLKRVSAITKERKAKRKMPDIPRLS